MKPIAGFVIGRIGDKTGRKFTVFISTSIMAISCVAMANIGTYTEIGIVASIVVIICRMMQTFSSLGEITGAELYIIEIFKPPYRYVYSAIIRAVSRAGGLLALIVALFTISAEFNWRSAFWIGAVIVAVGIIIMVRINETSEFTNYKQAEPNEQNFKVTKIEKQTIIAYFFIRTTIPTFSYITFIYFSAFMEESLGFTTVEIMNQNLKVVTALILLMAIPIYFVRKYHPIKIVKINTLLSVIFLLFIPYWISNISDVGNSGANLVSLSLLQIASNLIALSTFGETMCFGHFAISRRFTLVATISGISITLSYAAVSLSLTPLINCFGYYGLWFIYLPVTIGFLYGINHIEKLERERGSYLNYPYGKS